MPVQASFASPVHYSSGIDHSYELHENYANDGLPPFQFRKRSGEINWRKLSALDVDKVARELDFVSLQENISTVTFCNIDSVSDVDPLFAKLFKLGQFIIEYLLHSQEYLQSVVSDFEAKLDGSLKNNEALQQKITEMEEEVLKVKLENKKRRKMIQQQQMLIEAGASSYYQCPHCEKAFMNASFLQGHMQRRHPGSVNYIGDVIADSQKAQTKLGDQLKNLEGELKTEREDFNRKLKKAEEEKEKWAEQSRRDMDRWKEKEEARWKEELNAMRESFISDIEKLQVKEEGYQKTITELQQTMDVRHSNLGELVDDFHEEKYKLQEYEARVSSLEQMNNAKNQKIEELTSTMRRLGKDASLLHQQERKMEQLKNKVDRSATNDKVTKLQRQLDRLSRSETQPKKLFISDDDSESTTEIDGALHRSADIKGMLPQMRHHILTLLDEKLKSCGVDPAAAGITSATLTRKLMVLKTERQQAAKVIQGYYQTRENLRRKMDESTRKKAPPTGAPKTTPKKPKKAPTPKKRKARPSSSQGSRRKVPVQRSPQRSPRGQRSTKDKTGGQDKGDSFLPSSSGIMTQERVHDRSTTRASPISSPRQQNRSPWDSEDDSRAPSAVSDWDDVDDILDHDVKRADQPAVKDLTKTIQDKLNKRKPPPVGAVDVSPKQETAVEEFNVDEDDSFLVSSMEEEVNPAPRPRGSRPPPTGGLRKSAASNSSNTFGTSVWGSGQKDTREKHDDSDWDDDLDIDELMT